MTPGKLTFPSTMFDEQIEVEFEKHKFFGTNDPDRILTITYGDYLKMPPEDEQKPHHTITCWVDD